MTEQDLMLEAYNNVLGIVTEMSIENLKKVKKEHPELGNIA